MWYIKLGSQILVEIQKMPMYVKYILQVVCHFYYLFIFILPDSYDLICTLFLFFLFKMQGGFGSFSAVPSLAVLQEEIL